MYKKNTGNEKTWNSQKIQSIIVEGGAKLLHSFIETDLWDEARILTGKKQLFNGMKAPKIQGQEIFSTEIEGDHVQIIIR